jgi:branched-chain amino acid transport system permease protein
MSFSGAVQVTVGGIATGAIYAILLIGILLVYQVSKKLNFAYGQTGMAAAFSSWYLLRNAGVPPWVAVLAGVLLAAVIAGLTDYLVVRRISEDRPGYDLVVTLGVLLILTAAAELLFGTDAHSYLDFFNTARIPIMGTFVNGNDLLVIGLGLAVSIAIALVIGRTSLGVSLRASAERPIVAQSVGINVFALRTSVWAFSGLVAAAAAIFIASRLSVDAYYMTPFLINAFIAGMLGGLDRFWPPLLAAVVLGVYQAWVIYAFGPAAATPAVFVLTIAVLALAPKRFVEEDYEARA